MRIKSSLLLILFIVSFITVSCSNKDPEYTVSYCTADKEPVWIERVKFDDYPMKSGGMLLNGWKQALGLIELFPPPPVPKQIYIYWFNYRQQVFYEATIPLQKDAAKIMKALPKPDYGRYVLTTGVLPDGSAVVWVGNSLSSLTGTWTEVGHAKGHLAKGDPASRKNTTEEMRQKGEI